MNRSERKKAVLGRGDRGIRLAELLDAVRTANLELWHVLELERRGEKERRSLVSGLVACVLREELGHEK